MGTLAFDVAHLLAGSLVLVSFMMLYQDRLYALLNVFALHALVLAASVAWQAFVQDAPHLYVTAAIALIFKAIIIPVALHQIIVKLGIHRQIETVVGVGPTMLLGMGLVALSMVIMLRVTSGADPLAREDLAFALSVVLLGLLMMVTRRNAVSQVVGFMSLENGLVLAATGAKGMPLVVEISVAFSVLIAFIVIGIFLFRIRERFDTVDVQALDHFRGERRQAQRNAQVAPPLAPAEPDLLPASIDKSQLAIAAPKRLRDKAHLKFVASQPCLVCGRQPSDPHHLRFAQPRALGLKVSDEFTVPLCRGHHRQLHQAGNEEAWWENLRINALEIARGLWVQTQPLSATKTVPHDGDEQANN